MATPEHPKQPSIPEVAKPGQPVEDKTTRIWILTYFINGNNGGVKQLFFEHTGDFKSAHTRIKLYCERRGIRFINIGQFLTDIDIVTNQSLNDAGANVSSNVIQVA